MKVYTFISRFMVNLWQSVFLFFFIVLTVQAQQIDQLNIATTIEPSGLDPHINATPEAQKITYQNIFEGLTKIDDLNQVHPNLAISWQVDKSKLIYTFKLRKNVFFHDHRPLTATIVQASLSRVITSNESNPIKYKLNEIDQITVISKHVVRIKLNWFDGHFLYKLGLANAVIQHPKSWPTNSLKPIGTGPYRFVDWKKGEYLRLVANTYYWGDLARIKNIKIVFSKIRSQIMSYFIMNQVDAYFGMTDVSFLDALLATRKEYILSKGNTSGEIIIAMNHANKMLASLDVRRAITMAINKKEIIATPGLIVGQEIGSHYSPGDSAYLDLSNAYPLNIRDAKLLIKKSEVAIKPLILLSPPSAYAQYIGTHIKMMLQKVGLRVTIEEVTWKEWLTRVYKNKDYDLTIIVNTEPYDLDIYARDDYYVNYKNSDFQEIIRQLNQAQDKNKRDELLKKAQQKLSDDAVNVYLFMLPNVGVWHKSLRGYWLNQPIPAMIFSQMYWQ